MWCTILQRIHALSGDCSQISAFLLASPPNTPMAVSTRNQPHQVRSMTLHASGFVMWRPELRTSSMRSATRNARTATTPLRTAMRSEMYVFEQSPMR